MTQRRLQRQVSSHCPVNGKRRPACFVMSRSPNSLSCTVVIERRSISGRPQGGTATVPDEIVTEQLLEETMHVPSRCPLADLERPTDVSDDLAHRARPIDGVPDLDPYGVEAQ